ncbi:MAG: hypothetical protein D6706_00320 [Chloroflexi bacterium]|nr:MAG: hypothetical protein D6706_00320 [Chloroflexota bacterium]
MIWQFEPYALIVAFAAMLAVGQAILVWRQRGMPGALPLFGLSVLVFIWLTAYTGELISVPSWQKLMFVPYEVLGLVGIPGQHESRTPHPTSCYHRLQ